MKWKYADIAGANFGASITFWGGLLCWDMLFRLWAVKGDAVLLSARALLVTPLRLDSSEVSKLNTALEPALE